MKPRSRTIWRILTSRLKKHAGAHLIVPLVIGILVESCIEVFQSHAPGTSISHMFADFRQYVFSSKTLILIAGVFASYVVIMYALITKETRFTEQPEAGLNTLQDVLDHAKSYFGVSSFKLKDWFDPSMQVYMNKLITRKSIPDNFRHERTLLFFSNSEYYNSGVRFMDEFRYGDSLAQIHRDSEIPLSFLRRKDIFDILENKGLKEGEAPLSEEELERLGCYPRWTNSRFTRFLRKLPLSWLRRRIKTLDFATVRTAEGELALLVSKTGDDVDVEPAQGERAAPYVKLQKKIRDKVYDGKGLSRDYNFVAKRSLPARKSVESGSLLEYYQDKLYRFTGQPYRENFKKKVTVTHNAGGTYAVQEETSYVCRRGMRHIQDKIEWYIEEDDEKKIEYFRITLRIPSRIFAGSDFKKNNPTLKSPEQEHFPEKQNLTPDSTKPRWGYRFDLREFREIDGLEIETVVRYRGSNGHIFWMLGYPTKGFDVEVDCPHDRKLRFAIFGAEESDITKFKPKRQRSSKKRQLYRVRCNSWLLPTTGGLIQFCQSQESAKPSGSASAKKHKPRRSG